MLRSDLTFLRWMLWNAPANTMFLLLQVFGLFGIAMNWFDANSPHLRSAAPLLVLVSLFVGVAGGGALAVLQVQTLQPAIDRIRWISLTIVGATLGWACVAFSLFWLIDTDPMYSYPLFSPSSIVLAAIFAGAVGCAQALSVGKAVCGSVWWGILFTLVWTVGLLLLLHYLSARGDFALLGVWIPLLAIAQAALSYAVLWSLQRSQTVG